MLQVFVQGPLDEKKQQIEVFLFNEFFYIPNLRLSRDGIFV